MLGFYSLDARKESFQVKSCPFKRKRFADLSKNLLAAGFYFAPLQTKKDRCVCYLCHSAISSLNPGDDPFQIHASKLAECPLVIIHESSSQLDKICSNTVLQARILSFGDHWPLVGKGWESCSTENMARAGFSFNPDNSSSDNVVCKYCDLQLDGWELGDLPLVEHSNRKASCPFLVNLNKTKAPTTTVIEKSKNSTTAECVSSTSNDAEEVATPIIESKKFIASFKADDEKLSVVLLVDETPKHGFGVVNDSNIDKNEEEVLIEPTENSNERLTNNLEFSPDDSIFDFADVKTKKIKPVEKKKAGAKRKGKIIIDLSSDRIDNNISKDTTTSNNVLKRKEVESLLEILPLENGAPLKKKRVLRKKADATTIANPKSPSRDVLPGDALNFRPKRQLRGKKIEVVESIDSKPIKKDVDDFTDIKIFEEPVVAIPRKGRKVKVEKKNVGRKPKKEETHDIEMKQEEDSSIRSRCYVDSSMEEDSKISEADFDSELKMTEESSLNDDQTDVSFTKILAEKFNNETPSTTFDDLLKAEEEEKSQECTAIEIGDENIPQQTFDENVSAAARPTKSVLVDWRRKEGEETRLVSDYFKIALTENPSLSTDEVLTKEQFILKDKMGVRPKELERIFNDNEAKLYEKFLSYIDTI